MTGFGTGSKNEYVKMRQWVYAFMKHLCWEGFANKVQREPQRAAGAVMEKRPLQREPVSSFDLWRLQTERATPWSEAKLDPEGGAMHPETKMGL